MTLEYAEMNINSAIIGEDCGQAHLAGIMVTLDRCPGKETRRIDYVALADRAPARMSASLRRFFHSHPRKL